MDIYWDFFKFILICIGIFLLTFSTMIPWLIVKGLYKKDKRIGIALFPLVLIWFFGAVYLTYKILYMLGYYHSP